MQVGTYPTRNFATLGPLLLRPPFTGASVQSVAGRSQLTSPFNLPAPGRRQTLYVVFDFAESCVFSKQSPGPLYCNSFPHTIARIVHGNRAPLIPKLRCQFAEFLNEGSHSRLRIFSSPTCVGLRYGYPLLSLEAFLGSMASTTLRGLRPST